MLLKDLFPFARKANEAFRLFIDERFFNHNILLLFQLS
jgi:hypothetical protein